MAQSYNFMLAKTAMSEQAFKYHQEPHVKLAGAPFPLITRVDMSDINRVR
jgi:hypothetical protein